MRRIKEIKIISILMMFILLAACTRQNMTVSMSDYYIEAEKAVLTNDYAEALKLYYKMLELYSEEAVDENNVMTKGLIYFNIGYCYEALGQREEAISAYIEGTKEPRAELITLTALGSLYFQSKDYEISKKYYLEAIEYDENAYEAYVNLSAIYSLEKDYDMALSLLTKAIEVDHNKSDAYINRGYLFAMLGDRTLMEADVSNLKQLKEPNLDVYIKIYEDVLQENKK